MYIIMFCSALTFILSYKSHSLLYYHIKARLAMHIHLKRKYCIFQQTHYSGFQTNGNMSRIIIENRLILTMFFDHTNMIVLLTKI